MDAQLPRRLCDWLLSQEHDAIHTLDLLGKNNTPDGEIADVADAGTRIVITKDADFVHSHFAAEQTTKAFGRSNWKHVQHGFAELI